MTTLLEELSTEEGEDIAEYAGVWVVILVLVVGRIRLAVSSPTPHSQVLRVRFSDRSDLGERADVPTEVDVATAVGISFTETLSSVLRDNLSNPPQPTLPAHVPCFLLFGTFGSTRRTVPGGAHHTHVLGRAPEIALTCRERDLFLRYQSDEYTDRDPSVRVLQFRY